MQCSLVVASLVSLLLEKLLRLITKYCPCYTAMQCVPQTVGCVQAVICIICWHVSCISNRPYFIICVVVHEQFHSQHLRFSHQLTKRLASTGVTPYSLVHVWTFWWNVLQSPSGFFWVAVYPSNSPHIRPQHSPILLLSFTTVRNRHNTFLWHTSWLLFNVIHAFVHCMNIISNFLV
jgi:hypothetical protein